MAWRDDADLLGPDFFDPDTDQWHIAVQGWVVEVDGQTVVVDTGVGNDRARPHMPPLDHLNTGFLAALQLAGIDRDNADVVVNTLNHSDHVGWNTMGDNDTRVPTFANARYVLPAADLRRSMIHSRTLRPVRRRTTVVRFDVSRQPNPMNERSFFPDRRAVDQGPSKQTVGTEENLLDG